MEGWDPYRSRSFVVAVMIAHAWHGQAVAQHRQSAVPALQMGLDPEIDHSQQA